MRLTVRELQIVAEAIDEAANRAGHPAGDPEWVRSARDLLAQVRRAIREGS